MIVAAALTVAAPVAVLACWAAVVTYRGVQQARSLRAPVVALLWALCGLLAVYGLAQLLALVPLAVQAVPA